MAILLQDARYGGTVCNSSLRFVTVGMTPPDPNLVLGPGFGSRLSYYGERSRGVYVDPADTAYLLNKWRPAGAPAGSKCSPWQCPGSAQLLPLLSARLVALCTSALPGWAPATGTPATAYTARARPHAWSNCPLGSAPARPLCLFRARLAALGGSALPG